MLPSSASSSLSRKIDRLSRPGTPSNPNSPPKDIAELSDVPCYTCRRRHVKCDRTLPGCKKCNKKGVPCLGYQKPLRWAEGVAVRGKLKGKTEPVVDDKVVSIVQNTMELASHSTMKEAVHFGLHATQSSHTDVARDEATLMELMTYHNNEMCAESVTFRETKFIDRAIARLSLDVIQKLPRDIVNCILGNAAVHMASRQLGNRQLERLALEAKVKVFQSFNRLLQSPQNQQPDVIVCCGILIYAMDLFEHGMSRWMLHFLGSIQVMSSFGGIENLFNYYPHLQLPLTHVAHFETVWIILSHVPTTMPKQASRKAVEMLCRASLVKRKFYNPCPSPLLPILWDIGSCASALLGSSSTITPSELYRREKILQDILAYLPGHGIKDVKKAYHKDIPITKSRIRSWDLISTTWKGAMTILALRYLFFGRSNLAPESQVQGARTPPMVTQSSSWFTPRDDVGVYYQGSEEIHHGDFLDETEEALPEHLSAGLFLHDPLSRGPSPVPSIEPPNPSLWPNRYEIHNEAFSALSTSFFTLFDYMDPIYLRYIVLPLIILALVSRPGSAERALCFSYFDKFKQFMATKEPPKSTADSSYSRERTTSPSPLAGEHLDFDIPWEKLDAFSEATEHGRRNDIGQGFDKLTAGAPEWNWWDMLNHLKLDFVWPCTSGTSHLERGSEFWAFTLISSVVNDDCFSAWTKPPAIPQPSTSS
ncbi:hypothetical protein K469DRAFT_710248 [Zopfia rhizophila CBS 207.26]|uniref:Zn(2)-C6 fungal-type domain-containing protein n=1 Tax=Zopfia rhizophila CBS 207.26 TaxID=1314779 RepID=A0A6A6DZZ4_9PEZI|nr:hypothetical protein K469DRAFT_710248 [Zopfia rhizophila CBS 207.26]